MRPVSKVRTVVSWLLVLQLLVFANTDLVAAAALGNSQPVAVNDSYTTYQDTQLNVAAAGGVLGNDTDADGQPLTARLVSAPTSGSLTLNADGSFSYTPLVSVVGTDSFTYVASDGTAKSNIATVTITVSPPAPAVSLSPTGLAFPSQAVGTASSPLTITLTNSGTAPLTISSVTITGTNPGDFTRLSACGTTLIPSGSCLIYATFTPAAAGTRSAVLTIVDNAAGSPHTAALTGASFTSGPIANVGSSSLDFGDVEVTQSNMQSLSVVNNGTAPLTIDQWSFTGDFLMQDMSQACEYPLAPGQQCWMSIAFTPHAPGTQTGTLTISTNAANSSTTVSLTGRGTTPWNNMLLNSSFEVDTNGDSKPDSWSTNKNVTRNTAHVKSGAYAMRHRATNNANYTVSQTITNVIPGDFYTFLGYVNIPATSDAFTFGIEVLWRDAKNGVLATNQVTNYQGPTEGWQQATGVLMAPPKAVKAEVRMVVSSLNATVYADDFMLLPTGD